MHLLHNVLVFGRLLRAAGLEVHMGRLLDVAEALQCIDLSEREEVLHACRSLLVHRHEDLDDFDRAFEVFWGRLLSGGTTSPDEARGPAGHGGSDAGSGMQMLGDAAHADTAGGALRTWSDLALLAEKDFAEFTAEEAAVARAALDALDWQPGDRRTRRWRAGHGARVDIRRALANSVRTGGDLIVLPRRRRAVRPRPLVLVCDVSGSMERYSRMLLHFAHAISGRYHRVEVFLFSTRVTRVTRELHTRGIDRAVAGVARAVPDWSGGTRIGDALKQLHMRWMRRVRRGGPVVLLISDGWDRGDPALLRAQVARLQRSCHRLIWLNPLIGTKDYAPLTRGLQAALPFVDDFLPARTLTNLADLAVHLNALPSRPARTAVKPSLP